jgi:hypothetical protein
MLVKSYNHLHLVEDVAFGFADQDCGLSIFQMTSNNVKTKEIVTKELLDITKFHVDVKDIKPLSNGGRNMSLYSLQLVYL